LTRGGPVLFQNWGTKIVRAFGKKTKERELWGAGEGLRREVEKPLLLLKGALLGVELYLGEGLSRIRPSAFLEEK